MAELKETQVKLYDATELIAKMEGEMKKMSLQRDHYQKQFEKKKDSVDKYKEHLKEKCD